MSAIVLVPGRSNQFAFTTDKVKAARPTIKVARPKRSGAISPIQKPTPVIAKPDTGWPPIKVFSALVNRVDLEKAVTYGSWAELLRAVEQDPAAHLGAYGQLYARVTTEETFDLNRAKRVLRELGGKRLVVEYQAPGHNEFGIPRHGRRRQISK
jgi:hypothetical protein